MVYSVNDEKFSKPYSLFKGNSRVHRLEISQDGANLIVFNLDFQLSYVQLKDEIVRKMSQPHDGSVISGDVSKQGVVSVGSDGILQIFDSKEFELQAKH